MNKMQKARIERERHIRDNADFFTVMVWRVGKMAPIPTLEQAQKIARDFVKHPYNALPRRPAMVYACTQAHMNEVLVGTIRYDGTWHEAS